MKHGNIACCVSTSQPSTALLSGGGGGALTLVCPFTGAIQSSLPVSGELSAGTMGVHSLSLFPPSLAPSNTTKLALGYGVNPEKPDDTYGILLTIRPANLPPLLRWKCRLPEASLTAGLVVSPNGHCVVGGSATGNIYIWNSLGGALLRSFKAHYRGVSVLTWSDNGNMLLTGGADGMVHVFAIADIMEQPTNSQQRIQPIRTCSHHKLRVTSVSSCGGGRLASAGEDGQVVLYEMFSDTILAAIQLSEPVSAMTERHRVLYCGCKSGKIVMIALDEYAMYKAKEAGATVVVNSITTSHVQQVFGTNTKSNTPYQYELVGHNRSVTALAVVTDDNDDELLVSGDELGVLRVWNVYSHTCVRQIQPWAIPGTTNTVKTVKHPITSISVVVEDAASINNSQGATMTTRADRSNQRKSEQSTAAGLVIPLQRFPIPLDDTVVPFLHREERSWRSAPEFSYQSVLGKRQRRDNVSSKRVDDLEQQLNDAKVTIARWEAVNNKLMQRLTTTHEEGKEEP